VCCVKQCVVCGAKLHTVCCVLDRMWSRCGGQCCPDMHMRGLCVVYWTECGLGVLDGAVLEVTYCALCAEQNVVLVWWTVLS
jgi:hypothetical protein